MQSSWLSPTPSAAPPTNDNEPYYKVAEITIDSIFLACFEQLGLSVVKIASDLVNCCDRDDSHGFS